MRRNWSSIIFGACAGYLLAAVGLTVPFFQKHALYLHLLNPTYFQKLDDVESFGFFKEQVQAFTLRTLDNVTMYGWHILPTHLYLEHEAELVSQKYWGPGEARDVVETIHGRLLNDPKAHVVISFHGNAAHLASSHRPTTCQAMLGLSSPERPVHVIAFDYRGFGLSTGSPSEEGLLTDGTTLLSFLTGLGEGGVIVEPAIGIDPSQIVLLGQSLGTAAAAGVYHRWTRGWGLPNLRGLVLIASFPSLPELIWAYSLKGVVPRVFAPLQLIPGLKAWIEGRIAERWETSWRLADLTATPGLDLNLTLLHARNDGDIPWQEGWKNWQAAVKGANGTGRSTRVAGIEGDGNLEVLHWESNDGRKRLRWERVMRGGHNRVATSEQAKMAVLRILEGK